MANYGYARVSTADQNEGMQVDALQNAKCEKIFIDKASGAKSSRPALDDMLSKIQDGDTVTIWKLDRLGRSTVHLFNLLEDLKKRGVSVRSLTEGIDTAGSLGRFLFTILAGVAELERENIKQRVNAGLQQAKREGVKLGRKEKFSTKDKALIRRLHTLGDSYTKLSREFNASRSTIWQIINVKEKTSFQDNRQTDLEDAL
ncbi:recombinase family protein [Gluconacetobacter entanii]|uniref:Recombinase family protein n=1 Tax=Gluconacetobacter entanii TaxID=108528 RepID=A0ABT3K232_9PROT|nr:recombinase family protein [Gluconacetobacter entanii]MCW4589459.1 recombinase family protein [Gluconacetobacter entanii]MCW4593159.1 recombinase family protein [Gluconacetobacter entanii]NPC90302.1 recombinase family protein [Gluconacetobacter entanii]